MSDPVVPTLSGRGTSSLEQVCGQLKAALDQTAMPTHTFGPAQRGEATTGLRIASHKRFDTRFAPELSYGRHAGPPSWNARPAAVVLLVYPQNDTWLIPLTLRPFHLATHAGQVSFPGGAMDAGEDYQQCARREWHEELGSPEVSLDVLGHLPPICVFASNYFVVPCVAIARQRPAIKPNLNEVADVIELPLAELCDERNYGEHIERRGPLAFRAPHIAFNGHQIWGATAMILGEFIRVLEEVQRAESGEQRAESRKGAQERRLDD